jgi:putative holliday junction resolvase
MSKILGIDYGLVRTGIAITDSSRIIASPLQTVPTKELNVFLEKLFLKEKIEVVVIGEARYLNGESSDITIAQQKFADGLKKKYPLLIIERIDEAFTSQEAARSLIAMGMKKSERQNKGNLDMISAALFLRYYMDKK